MFLVLIFGSSVIIYNKISSSSSSSPLPSLSLSDPTTIDDDDAAEVQQAMNQPAHHSSICNRLNTLWRLTGDWKYRIWGLEIFKSMEKHCKVESGGYSGIKNVRGGGGGKKRRKEEEGEEGGEVMEKDDTQKTFFIAETLKYLWLLVGGGDDEGWDWENGWVMNTEAHPLRVVG
jgi:hypothetical protein